MIRIAMTLAAMFALLQPAVAQTFLPGPSPTIWVESVSPNNLGCKAQGRFKIRTGNWNITTTQAVVIISTSTGIGDPPGPGPTVTSDGLAISGSASFGSGARTYGSAGTTINIPPGNQNQNIHVPFKGTVDNVGRVHFTVKADATNRYTVICGGCGYFYFQTAC